METRQDPVRSVTESILDVIAPEETLLVQDYQPAAVHAGVTSRGPRGIGAETVIALLLPVVYRFVEKLIDRASTRVADASFDVLRKWMLSSTPASNEVLKSIQQSLVEAGMEVEKARSTAPAVASVLQKKCGVVHESFRRL